MVQGRGPNGGRSLLLTSPSSSSGTSGRKTSSSAPSTRLGCSKSVEAAAKRGKKNAVQQADIFTDLACVNISRHFILSPLRPPPLSPPGVPPTPFCFLTPQNEHEEHRGRLRAWRPPVHQYGTFHIRYHDWSRASFRYTHLDLRPQSASAAGGGLIGAAGGPRCADLDEVIGANVVECREEGIEERMRCVGVGTARLCRKTTVLYAQCVTLEV
jgi:hypothetical protein